MYKAIIIGSGPGGYPAALRIAELGGSVAIVEKSELGGVCTNSGCIPTKSLWASAELFETLRKSKDYGIEGSFNLNFADIMKRKDRIVKVSSMGVKKLLEDAGVEIITGTGEIASKKKVKIKETGKILDTENIIIATGSSSAKEMLGLNSLMDNKDLLSIKELPRSLLIIGGGVMGVEFASIFSSFGVKVTIVELLDRLVANEDKEISETLQRTMERKGITVYTSSKVESIDGKKAKVKTPKGIVDVEADKFVAAVGIRSNIPPECESLGITCHKKGIEVDDCLRTSIKNIYAVGDVTGKFWTAHVAIMQGIVAAENIMGKKRSIDYSAVPNGIFTLPEIASVGVFEGQIGKFNLAASGKARAMGKTEGFVKVFVKKDILVGCCAIGHGVTDIISEAALAIKNKLKVEDITSTIHPHPTLPEAFVDALRDVK